VKRKKLDEAADLLRERAGGTLDAAIILGSGFGGVLRDIVCNQIPMVLRDGRPYALCSFAGCWIYLLMRKVEIDPTFALWFSVLFIVLLRLLTWFKDVRIK